VSIARKMLALLSRRERLQLVLLFALVLINAVLEMISVASVLPFLSVAANPSRIKTNAWLSWSYEAFRFASTNRFLVALAATALIALVLSNSAMAAGAWSLLRFTSARNHSIGVRLLRHYLSQPYVFFLQRNSADLDKNILSEVQQVINQVLMAGLRFLTRAIVALAIVALLIAFDPLLALIVSAALGGAYGAIHLHLRRKLVRLGAERVVANGIRYRVAGEAFGAIKDVKLLGREDIFVARFIGPSRRYNQSQATAEIIGEIPRYALEVLAFGGVLVIAIYLILRGDGLQQVIPVLGLYAFAGYRLLPSLQQIFSAYTKLRFGASALNNLHRELTSLSAPPARTAPAVWRLDGCGSEPLLLTDRLEVNGVAFTYPGAYKPALDHISLAIEAYSTIGIVGPTGSGKTTLVDVILGLLRPQVGEIRVDGVPLSDSVVSAWQSGLGYVPQHIYLTDDTVARNIAFGIPDAQIDLRAVERTARLANIHEFITHELPRGYDTVVGERGIRLSGGQRQRIGIARALYHDPTVLVFDEATSALDTGTEAAVMEAIQHLTGTKTILMIAHRLTTLRGCDVLYVLRDGRLVETSTYEGVTQTGAGLRHQYGTVG
jgi:ABC-type multidrug transport system fused ATPase/permease subunit